MERSKDAGRFQAALQKLAARLRTLGLDDAASGLDGTAKAAYTSSSEYCGEAGLALRRVQRLNIDDRDVRAEIKRLLKEIHTVWPSV